MATDQGPAENTTRQPDLEGKMWSPCEDSAMVFVADECDLVSDTVDRIFQMVNFVILLQIIDLFGTGTNILNMVCFVKQGLKDPSNVSLLGLAISDLLSMATLIWLNICVTPEFYKSDLPFDPEHISYPTTATHQVAFTRVSCWITAFITLERCLCVALPLKIKRILTAKTAIIVNITVFVIIYCGNVAPVYHMIRFAMLPHPRKPNTTWLGITFTEDRSIVERYSYAINNCFLPFGAFIIISVSTVVLVVKLKSKTKWRKQSTAPGISDSISIRDQAVSKMVVMISTVFILCYAPVCIIFIGMLVVPELSTSGRYKNLASIIISSSYIVQSINASFNIFIYYNVSSKYRRTFRQMFCALCHRGQSKYMKTQALKG